MLIRLLLILVLLAPIYASADVVDDRKKELQAQLDQIEAQIDQQQKLLDAKSQERTSLERDVAILDAQINKAKLQIQARNIAISGLNTGISQKQDTISSLEDKLGREKQSLAQILRKTNEIGEYSLVEVALSSKDVSSFYEDVDDFASVQQSLSASFDLIANTKSSTEDEKSKLLDKRTEEVELRRLQTLEKSEIESKEGEKQQILSVTKGQEKAYQELIADKQKTAAQIRAELFSLRDTAAIPFGEALKYAEKASAGTGVRPALILGVLKQETKLGEYLGTGNWQTDMHPTRDRPVFQALMSILGLDPNSMPVSKKPSYGWGGAMGPAQFIPSTWVCYGGLINTRTNDCNNSKRSLSWNDFWQGPWVYKASKDRIRNYIGGDDPSNPYTNEDAFTAAATLLRDNGAAKGTREAERLAALRYFAGWANASKPQYAFYGDGVMSHADFFQNQIDILYGS